MSVSIFQKEKVLTTPRLKVVKFKEPDFELFHRLQSDFEVMKYATGKANSEEENREEFEKIISYYQKERNRFWVWSIHHLALGYIGTCALILENDHEAEVGFRVLRKYWGRGFGTEVNKGLIQLSKETGSIQKLFAYVDERNIGSIKVLEKSGFVKIEILEQKDSKFSEFKYHYPLNNE